MDVIFYVQGYSGAEKDIVVFVVAAETKFRGPALKMTNLIFQCDTGPPSRQSYLI